jgi:hypothetical protein
MLTEEKARALSNRLDRLSCVAPPVGDDLFLYVFRGEPTDEADLYQSHMRDCEFCRTALEVYRYKRGIAKAMNAEGPHDE